MTCRYAHVYRCPKGTRIAAGENREWKGRPEAILRTYMIWPDGALTEVPVKVAKGVAA